MSVTSRCTPNVSKNEHENKCMQMSKNSAAVTGPVSAGTRPGHHIAWETQCAGMYTCPRLAQSARISHAGRDVGAESKGSSARTALFVYRSPASGGIGS